MYIELFKKKFKKPPLDTRYRTFWQYIHVDVTLAVFLLLLCSAGLIILFSASGQHARVIELQSCDYYLHSP